MSNRERVIYGVIARREPEGSHEWVAELAADIDRHLRPDDGPDPFFTLALSGLAWAVGHLEALGEDREHYAAKVLAQLSNPPRIYVPS